MAKVAARTARVQPRQFILVPESGLPGDGVQLPGGGVVLPNHHRPMACLPSLAGGGDNTVGSSVGKVLSLLHLLGPYWILNVGTGGIRDASLLD